MSTQEDFSTCALRDEPNLQQRHVSFKVTTPLFYTQIARCTSILESINAALSKPDPEKATFHTSHPDLIRVFKKTSSANSTTVCSRLQPWSTEKPSGEKVVLSHTITLPPASLLDRIRWASIRLFRRFPSPHNRYSLSDLDTCAVHLFTADAPKARAYRKAVLRLLLSDYVAFGVSGVIDAVLWIIRIWLCWLCVQSFDGLVELRNERGRLSVPECGKIVLSYLGGHLW